jgi:hypothetical protein
MAVGITQVSDVQAQVKTFWSDLFKDELVESSLLPSLVNREYQGDLKQEGDTVRVSQFNMPVAGRKGQNDGSFETQKLSTDYVNVTADQVITCAYEFNDLVTLQSQAKSGESKIRENMVKALLIELNNYLYSKVSPSTSSPDHSIASVSDYNKANILANRLLAAQAHWPKENRYALLDPSYYNDILAVTEMTSKDYVDDAPVIGGQIATKRFGFWILEDDSVGMRQVSPTGASADLGLMFHPDFMYLVMGEPTFELSSTHANKTHGFILSVKMVVGAALGIDGNVKHIVNYNS